MEKSKKQYKISYRRLACFLAAVVLLCGLIVFAIHHFIADNIDTSNIKVTSVTEEMDTMFQNSAKHEQLLRKAIEKSPMVKTAVPNIGYKGGKKFWKYCDYNYHIDWCACFVSWCAGKNGYIADGKLEMFTYVPYGVNMFKEMKKWKSSGYKPYPGNLIFFDWDNDGMANHIGIVEYYYKGYVYTVEGNRDDQCVEKHYPVNSRKILGYGIIKE